MARNDPQVNLRIPPALKARLEESAQATGRSLTAEVVQRLEDSFLAGAVSDALLRARLLTLTLAAELAPHKPRMVTLVNELLSSTIESDKLTKRFLDMARDGDPIATVAHDTIFNKLDTLLERAREEASRQANDT